MFDDDFCRRIDEAMDRIKAERMEEKYTNGGQADNKESE